MKSSYYAARSSNTIYKVTEVTEGNYQDERLYKVVPINRPENWLFYTMKYIDEYMKLIDQDCARILYEK